MADYIDREAFIGWLKTIPLKDLSYGLGLCRVIMEDDFKRCIKNIPKCTFVDAVPVVRCRDCKHWGDHDDVEVPGETDKIKACGCAIWMIGENGYCSYGERRKEE